MQRPAVVLGVGQLNPVRPEVFCQLQKLRYLIDVVTVQDVVQRERKSERLDRPRRGDLAVVRAGSRDAVGQIRVRGLDADLHVVQARIFELLRFFGRERKRAGDEVGVEAEAMRLGHDVRQVAPLERLPAR